MKIHDEIYIHATGEFLAKQDEFSRNGIEYYLNQASEILNDNSDIVDTTLQASIAIHSLMLHDKEARVIDEFPDKGQAYADADDFQLHAAKSDRNLEFFELNGVGYEFDETQVEHASSLVREGTPLSVSLMREKIVRASGFDGVRINYIYHDVLDHVWLFGFMRDEGITSRYDDFIQEIGDPFHGNLMSRESELFSGIGFTSRRYLSDPEKYGKLSLLPNAVIELLQSGSYVTDPRITKAIEILNNDWEVAKWSGYVIKATVANLLPQREKWGAVKRVETDKDGNFKSTGEVVPILDPRYVSMIVETIGSLKQSKERYISAQRQLNLIMENIIARYIQTGKAVGAIALDEKLEVTPNSELTENIGLSTNYF